MAIFKLFERLDPLILPRRIEQGCRLPLIIVDWKHLVHSEDSIETPSCQIFAILAKLDNSYGLLANLKVVQMLQVIQLHILLLLHI